jgi:uncharacterized protein (UPF0335 family)
MATRNINEDLERYVTRIESRTAELDEAREDIKEIYIEVRSAGFDPKIVREAVKLRKDGALAKKKQHDDLLENYLHGLGMLEDTPLGQAAIEAEKK